MLRVLLGIILAASSLYPARAQDIKDAVYIAHAFAGHCAQNVGRVDKVAAAATALGYEPLDPDTAAMLAPQDPNADYQGWMVTEEDGPQFLLGISTSVQNGQEMTACAVANPSVAMDAILSRLEQLMQLGAKLDELHNAGQRYRVWSTNDLDPGSFLAVIDAPKMGVSGGTIALTSRKAN